MQDFDQELENQDIVTLFGEDGSEEDFRLLDCIEYAGEKFVVLLSLEDYEDGNGQVEILKISNYNEDTDEEDFETVEDMDLLEKIYEIFREQNKEMFNFSD